MSKRFFPFALAASESGSAPLLHAGAGDVPIDQQLADAFNANNAVLAYVHGIVNTVPVDPTDAPGWYRTFRKQFPTAQIHAMKWINTIAPNLITIPAGIADYARTWSTATVNVDSALDVLVQDPRNAAARDAVVTSLTRLIDGLGPFATRAADFRREVLAFAGEMTINNEGLRAAADLAMRESRGSRTEVQRLAASIKQLQREIGKWQAIQNAAAIASGFTVYVGTSLATLGIGIRFAFGIAAARPQVLTIIASSNEIRRLCEQIRQDSMRVDNLGSGLAMLDFLAGMLGDLSGLAQGANQQVRLVVDAWKMLGAELGAVVNGLRSASGDASRFDVAGLQRDVRAASDDWARLGDFCRKVAAVRYLEAAPSTIQLPT